MESVTAICVLILLFDVSRSSAVAEEPVCTSRFDFDYKMINKLIDLEQKIKEDERVLAEQQKIIEKFSMDGRGSTYVRWGRSTCPNDTTQVYTGYIAGKHYKHTGSGSDSLCLPNDPSWLNYTDGHNGNQAYIYGTELALDDDRDRQMFENAANSQDMPCAVCKTLKSTVLMIPARSSCYSGWKLEYKGYLVAQRYSHDGPGSHICLDSRPDFLPNGEERVNQHLLYKVESFCGPLPCPPYVSGRELACVVCSN